MSQTFILNDETLAPLKKLRMSPISTQYIKATLSNRKWKILDKGCCESSTLNKSALLLAFLGAQLPTWSKDKKGKSFRQLYPDHYIPPIIVGLQIYYRRKDIMVRIWYGWRNHRVPVMTEHEPGSTMFLTTVWSYRSSQFFNNISDVEKQVSGAWISVLVVEVTTDRSWRILTFWNYNIIVRMATKLYGIVIYSPVEFTNDEVMFLFVIISCQMGCLLPWINLVCAGDFSSINIE